MRVFVLIFLFFNGNVIASAATFDCGPGGYARLSSRQNDDLERMIAEQRYYWEKEIKRSNPQISFYRSLGIDLMRPTSAPRALNQAIAVVNARLDLLVTSGRYTEAEILRPSSHTTFEEIVRWRYYLEHPRSMAEVKRGAISAETIPIRDYSRPDFEELLRRYGISKIELEKISSPNDWSAILSTKPDGYLIKMYVELRQRYYDFIDPVASTRATPDLLPESLLKKPNADEIRNTLMQFLEHVRKGL